MTPIRRCRSNDGCRSYTYEATPVTAEPFTMNAGHPRRWLILAILTLSLVQVVASVSSMTLALPSLHTALDATAAQLVWINASYALVLAAVLLPFGALGDRFGRRGALLMGLAIIVFGALMGSTSDSALQVTLWRCTMGIGAGLVMPATLSILTSVFPPKERSRAIAIWSGFAGAGGAIGILAAGVLLEFFWWGSIFFVNVPIAVVLFALVVAFVPTSRDTQGRPLDPLGSLLSAIALSGLVFALIQGPEFGWANPVVLFGFATFVVVGTIWVAVETKHPHPMLDPSLFRIPQFGLGSLGIGTAFAVMFGMFFGLAQYMQYVLGYSPLGTAIRTLPFAVAMLTISPLGPQLAQRFGVHAVIGSGLSVTALGLTALITVDGTSGYLQVLIGLYIASAGMALALPAATEAIIGSLPQDKAGVASAVNDTTREVGAAVGIALLGSLLSLGYRGGVGDAFSTLGPEGAEAARDSVGAALHLASLTPEDVGGNLANRARDAFASGFSLSMGVGTVLILFVAVVVWRRFPRDRLSQPT
ncbi:MAG: MFS transporter [Acidimicrobiaceae bacterium]|nr:MFS transporter [Acidimicrobiaceae bacterium]